ncbi:DUF3127 domain-containing protein [uncultured Porphyromonas sp.]|jgi:hypothetical protein|uniref:DUF3127 domain-containing protein n=1 Tax=uncultured Porphyromonas sp. TaxID=159274 RepID=UPI00263746E5|nr:DUF3127 domain-containing protein [uncultured Porphyromonas sp.]
MELIGKIIQILPLQEGVSKAGNPWKKQEYILETLGTQYPRKVCFNLFGDNVDKFPMQVGQDVTVSIDIESREFNGRWYTDVRAWNVLNGVQLAGAPAPGFAAAPAQPVAPAPAPGFASAPAQPAPPAAPAQPTTVAAPTAADDLPF